MGRIKLKRTVFAGAAEDKEVKMETPCLKVMVKNFTDSDIYVGVGSVDEVTVDSAVLIKADCYQVVFVNENANCCSLFDTLTISGSGNGVVECIQLLY